MPNIISELEYQWDTQALSPNGIINLPRMMSVLKSIFCAIKNVDWDLNRQQIFAKLEYIKCHFHSQ